MTTSYKSVLTTAVIAAGLLVGASATVHAGATGGARENLGEPCLAHSTDVYHITFDGGYLAQVRVFGDGDTDLDVRVYDENGNLVASDLSYSDNCIVEWRPRWTGVFRIEVENLGGVYNRYDLFTN